MKTIRMLLTVALLLGAASIYTQAESQTLLAVSIPFGFTVEDQNFPAGDYTISDSFVRPEAVIQLRSSDGKYFAVIQTHPTYSLDPSAKSELIFQREGSVYFLSQIHTQGVSTGRELLETRAKALAQERSAAERK
jgi:hypothetical protein